MQSLFMGFVDYDVPQKGHLLPANQNVSSTRRLMADIASTATMFGCPLNRQLLLLLLTCLQLGKPGTKPDANIELGDRVFFIELALTCLEVTIPNALEENKS
jgi:hypothetical protein